MKSVHSLRASLLNASALILLVPALSAAAGETRAEKDLQRAVLSLLEGMKGAEYRVERSTMAKIVALAPRVVPVLIDLLDDPGEEHRENICAALWQIGDRRAVPRLLEILRDHAEHDRDWVARALCRMGDRQLVDELIGVLKDPDPDVRMTVGLDLLDLGDVRGRLPIDDMLREPNGIHRFCIITTLMDSQDPKYVPTWIAYCRLRDVNMSYHAANALGEMKERSAEDALRELWDEDLPMSLQLCGAFNLVRVVDDAEAFAFLLEAAEKGDSEAVREAVTCLGRIGDRKAVPALLAVLKKGGWRCRPEAARALGRIGDPSALPALRKALVEKGGDPDSLRIWAAFAMAKISGDEGAMKCLADAARDLGTNQQALDALLDVARPEELPAVLKAMEDDNSSTRKMAAKVIERIGGKKSVAPLIACLKDDCWDVRVIAARALRKITGRSFGENHGDWVAWRDEGGPRHGGDEGEEENAKPPGRERERANGKREAVDLPGPSEEARELIPRLNDKEFWVRNGALQSLRRIADKGTVSILIRHMQIETAWANRCQCAGALREIGDKRAVPQLIWSLEHDESLVVEHVAHALAKIKDPESPAALLDVVDRTERNNVKIWGLYALYRITGDWEFYDRFLGFVDTDGHYEQKAVLEALGWIGDDTAVKTLAESILQNKKYEKWKIRIIYVLSWTDNMKAVPYLLELLKDDVPKIRDRANRSLKRITKMDFGPDHKKWEAWYRKHEEDSKKN
ncbi:MAG: HEAT repeat domain-containing protein [Planctomycetota bacterium]